MSSLASSFEWRKKVQENLVKSSTMTRQYFFLLIDMMLTRPNKSMWNSCRGSSIDDSVLLLNDAFLCFPFWQASQRPSLVNLALGSPLNRFFVTNRFIALQFKWDNFLCHNQLSSTQALLNRHVISSELVELKSATYTFPVLFPVRRIFPVLLSEITQASLVNQTSFPLSHNWLILNKLCLSPSTSATASMMTFFFKSSHIP